MKQAVSTAPCVHEVTIATCQVASCVRSVTEEHTQTELGPPNAGPVPQALTAMTQAVSSALPVSLAMLSLAIKVPNVISVPQGPIPQVMPPTAPLVPLGKYAMRLAVYCVSSVMEVMNPSPPTVVNNAQQVPIVLTTVVMMMVSARIVKQVTSRTIQDKPVVNSALNTSTVLIPRVLPSHVQRTLAARLAPLNLISAVIFFTGIRTRVTVFLRPSSTSWWAV
jgi:hypothetical protein